jgi:hypothetical protein
MSYCEVIVTPRGGYRVFFPIRKKDDPAPSTSDAVRGIIVSLKLCLAVIDGELVTPTERVS